MFSFLQFMIGMNIARNPAIILVGAFYYGLYLGCNEFCESAKEIYIIHKNNDNHKNLANYKKYLSNYKTNINNKSTYFNY